jgi:predicted small integral membrane protein
VGSHTVVAMVILPRLARALNAPLIATILGAVLIAVAIIGMVTDDIRTLWAVIILIVGVINVLRAIPSGNAE